MGNRDNFSEETKSNLLSHIFLPLVVEAPTSILVADESSVEQSPPATSLSNLERLEIIVATYGTVTVKRKTAVTTNQ